MRGPTQTVRRDPDDPPFHSVFKSTECCFDSCTNLSFNSVRYGKSLCFATMPQDQGRRHGRVLFLLLPHGRRKSLLKAAPLARVECDLSSGEAIAATVFAVQMEQVEGEKARLSTAKR